MPTATTTAIITEDCPLCLERFTNSEVIYTMPCGTCHFNYCSKCADHFIMSSRDDYQMASDGSRQVKVHIACPQCRSNYPMDISKVLLLRRVHQLGSSAYTEDGALIPDQHLNATELTWKRDFGTINKKKAVDLSFGLYMKVTAGRRDVNVLEKAQKITQRVFHGLPELSGEVPDDEYDEYVDNPSRKSPRVPKDQADDSLFQGLHDCLGWDEKVFLTDLFTSADVAKLMQASMILNGVLKMAMSPTSQRPQVPTNHSQTNRNSVSTKKDIELLEKVKKSFPLAMHMPGYFIIPSFTVKQQYLSFENYSWDGTITPPSQSTKVFQTIYGDYYRQSRTGSRSTSSLECEYPRKMVIVQAVRGPAGRVGLRRGDIITHVNEVEWTGTAQELMEHIQTLHDIHHEQSISITVNATPELGQFLQIRKKLMEQAKVMLV